MYAEARMAGGVQVVYSVRSKLLQFKISQGKYDESQEVRWRVTKCSL